MKKLTSLLYGMIALCLTSCATSYNAPSNANQHKWKSANFSGSRFQDSKRGYEMRFEKNKATFSVQNTPKLSFYPNSDEHIIEIRDVQRNHVVGNIKVKSRYETQLTSILTLENGAIYEIWTDGLFGEVSQANSPIFTTRINNGLEVSFVQSTPNEEILEAAFVMQKRAHDEFAQDQELQNLQTNRVRNPYRPPVDKVSDKASL